MFASVVTALVLAIARYPGDGPAVSPSRRFTASSEERPDAAARYHHALVVVARGSGARQVLLEYPRTVTVAWAPDRDALAVTNHVGSTQSTVSLFVGEPGGAFRRVDVGDALYAAFPNLRGELVPYLHVHLEAVQWRRGGAVECRLHAYAGTGPELTHRYLVTVDGQARRLSGARAPDRAQPREDAPPAPPRVPPARSDTAPAASAIAAPARSARA